MKHDFEQVLHYTQTPEPFHFQFEVEGVHFLARRFSEGGEQRLVVWATLGFLPYTIESWERRNKIISIIEGARVYLSLAKFYVDHEHKIIVKGEQAYVGEGIQDFLLMPLLPFLQEALPFIRLIGENL